MRLLEYQKALVSEHPLRINVFMFGKHCWNLRSITFILIFIILRQIELKNIFVNQIQNVTKIC